MAIHTGHKIVSDSLIFSVDASNSKSYSPSQALDMSNKKNHGTRNNGVGHTNDGVKSRWTFDGTDDAISTPIIGTFFDNTTGFTNEMWFSSTKTTRQHIWNFGVGLGGANLNFNVNDGPYHIWFYWEGNGGNFLVINHTDADNNGIHLDDGNIHHAVFTHSGTSNKFYLDGIDRTSLMSTGGTQTMLDVNGGASRYDIGQTGTSSINFLGNCYSNRIYTRALTSDEVYSNYRADKERFGV